MAANDLGDARGEVGWGPASRRVASNLARLRGDRKLSTVRLAKALEELGNPIPATGITRIEKGQRRVDADDLVALAIALDVTPNALLLPPTPAEDVALTPAVHTSALNAWKWATGDTALPRESPIPLGYEEAVSRQQAFRHENRPYESGQHSTMRLILANPELFSQLQDVAAKAHASRVPLPALVQYLEAMGHLNVLEDMTKDPKTAGDAAVVTELTRKLDFIRSGDLGGRSAAELLAEVEEITGRLAGAPKPAGSATEREEGTDEES